MARWSLPMSSTVRFAELCEEIRSYPLPPEWGPLMRETLAAQWALESGWGTSQLAKKHYNYGGMKWRAGMHPYASMVTYRANDGRAQYCAFKSNKAWIEGFFARLDMIDAYAGWREAAQRGGDAWINHVGPTWVGVSPQHGQEYIRKVQAIRDGRFA